MPFPLSAGVSIIPGGRLIRVSRARSVFWPWPPRHAGASFTVPPVILTDRSPCRSGLIRCIRHLLRLGWHIAEITERRHGRLVAGDQVDPPLPIIHVERLGECADLVPAVGH